MSEREKFIRSCNDAIAYPNNLVYHNSYDHVLQSYVERLDEHEKRLFFGESRASLSIRDYDDDVKDFENITLCGNDDLQSYLSGKQLFNHNDPQCRFIFVHAPHARERLKTTRNMLMFTLTYHQVMPAFVDFLFPFGRQQNAQDFQFSGFRHEDRLSFEERGLKLPELGRSGRDIRMCYNLKAVEPSKGQAEWSWSVRQTATYHSFDVETGKAFWTIVKGDQLIKRRMEAVTKPGSFRILESLNSLAGSFSASLAAHLVLFDWCREHLRWYLNFLEERLQDSSRQTLLVNLDKSSSGNNSIDPQAGIQHMASNQICASSVAISEKGRFRSSSQIKRPPPYALSQKSPTPVSGPVCPFAESAEDSSGEEDFCFSGLQKIQFLEEKAIEIMLALEANITVLSELKQYYHETFVSEEWPDTLRQSSEKALKRFEKSTAGVINDLLMQQSRTKMLLRLLTDRKSLLYGILDFQNMKSNNLFAGKAQLSTEHMEAMTQDMHEIAHKTKQETVSMRIITLVTLFFLPGTFISTIMSTDIVQYQVTDTGNSQKVVQLGALQLYMAITVPLMLLTFAAWYGVYWWVDRAEDARSREKSQNAAV